MAVNRLSIACCAAGEAARRKGAKKPRSGSQRSRHDTERLRSKGRAANLAANSDDESGAFGLKPFACVWKAVIAVESHMPPKLLTVYDATVTLVWLVVEVPT